MGIIKGLFNKILNKETTEDCDKVVPLGIATQVLTVENLIYNGSKNFILGDIGTGVEEILESSILEFVSQNKRKKPPIIMLENGISGLNGIGSVLVIEKGYNDVHHNLTYQEIKNVDSKKMKGNVFVFSADCCDYHNTLEYALLLNKKAEGNSMLVINDFQFFFDSYKEPYPYDYFENFIEENLTEKQTAVFGSSPVSLEYVDEKFNKAFFPLMCNIVKTESMFNAQLYYNFMNCDNIPVVNSKISSDGPVALEKGTCVTIPFSVKI